MINSDSTDGEDDKYEGDSLDSQEFGFKRNKSSSNCNSRNNRKKTNVLESDDSTSGSESEETYNLSASYRQQEAESLTQEEYGIISDSDNDFGVKKATGSLRNMIESDSDDEVISSHDPPNVLERNSLGSLEQSNHNRNTQFVTPPDSDGECSVKKSTKNIIECVSDNDETYNLHEANTLELSKDPDNSRQSESYIPPDHDNLHDADTLELHKEIADITSELSKSSIIGNISESEETNSTPLSSKPQSPSKNHSVEIRDTTNKIPNPNRIRISDEFNFENFGKANDMLHSTLVQPNTPVNSSSGKRLLNKSADTPRVFKLSKESNTPRILNPIIPSRSPSPKISCISDDDDIIDVSSEEENIPKTPAKTSVNKIQKQTTLDNIFLRKEMPPVDDKEETQSILVSLNQLEEQQDKIRRIRSDLSKATNVLRTINMEHLPDKGQSIKNRHAFLESMLLEEVKHLSRMTVINNAQGDTKSKVKEKIEVVSWDEIEAKAGKVQPKTFGKTAMSTYNAQKAVTMDRLQQLHGSLETCPKESDLAKDPKGLKVELMLHQRRALAWMIWRETQKPAGGILADDMGLGKTLTMISLMLKSKELEKHQDDSEDEDQENVGKKNKKYNGGTLVVCPASLINQWSSELERRTKRGLASCEMYHGAKRETKPKRLAQHDMVVTTYSIVNNECEKEGAVFRVKWRRIVIDEAHQIRNHKSQTSEAICKLSAKSRWALTGTPVHNKELDMYALLKFLRCTPFDDLAVWKRWVGDKSTGGTERLHTVISSLMLRRTKAELIEKGSLNSLPERKWELISVNLTKPERDVYSKILIFSRTLFAQFLHQRADKNIDARIDQHSTNQLSNEPNQEYFHMRQKLLRMNNIRDVKQHEILVLLLRLRQICCHPSLITGMLHEDMELMGDEDQQADKANALDFLDQLNNLTIADDANDHSIRNVAEGIGEEALGLKEAARGVLNPSDPIFSKELKSSKIAAMLKVLRDKVIPNKDKAIIVSQWSSYLNLISQHIREEGIVYDQLDGSVPVPKRMAMVDRFNDPKDGLTVLLLSLTAGGVGLNLVGANHLFLLDLHWNPQLENQAQDRIYRMGQQKPVFVYKFMATDTIENRILELQEKKLLIANSMLTGTKQVISSKLSLQDLKMLFEM